MAFDGIVTKAISSELQQFCGARIDKIFQPNKNTIIIGFYFNYSNYALNICTDSVYYRINLTTHSKTNPKIAPNFCMVLRKHLLGLHIKNIITNNLERIVTIEFEGFDDVDDIISKKLIIELMGKHCNIILLDEENIIIDSLRHINNENTTRIIVPHQKYISPTSDKANFLDCLTPEDFVNKLPLDVNITNIAKNISSVFNGISKNFIQKSLEFLDIHEINPYTLDILYSYIKEIISNTDNMNLEFETINLNSKYDYILKPSYSYTNLSLNFFIDDFYYNKESSEEFKVYRNSVLKMILNVLNKYNKRLLNINQKLEECENMETYKLYGELITANLYKIKNENLDNISLENYYDDNKLISIPLDNKYTPSVNAKKYFKKYNKLKNTLQIVGIQKQETLKELEYIESIVYELENSSSINEISEIFEEISENVIFKEKADNYRKKKNSKIKKSTLTKNKTVSFNPLKYTIDNFTLLVGRNNKENDYLTLKYAKKTDLWFHTKDYPGSHAILQMNLKSKPDNDILVKCAEIVAYHSKARNSSNVPVDICEVKYVKKPNGAKPGMVIYTNNTTFNVTPKK